jgi:drug/metabolite transporter (DMT)-like permease
VAAIALALGASLTWGLADFFGPLQGRALGALRALIYVQLGGLIGIALIVAVRGAGPEDAGALLAVPAAVSGTLGLFSYYRGIFVGAISIVAPIAGVSAVVPVIFGIATGDDPSAWQLAGIVFALVGVFLAAREPAAKRPVRAERGPVEGVSGNREVPPMNDGKGQD